jgi:hypothetical protein
MGLAYPEWRSATAAVASDLASMYGGALMVELSNLLKHPTAARYVQQHALFGFGSGAVLLPSDTRELAKQCWGY